MALRHGPGTRSCGSYASRWRRTDRDDGGAQLAVQEVRAGGGWVTFRFLPPLLSTPPGDGYTLQLSAPDAPPSSVVWHGASGGSGLSIFTEGGGWEPSPGAGAYRERLTTFEVTGEDAWDETDQNYSVLWVWAWYARMHPEDAEFIHETWPLVRAFADHYLLTPGYLDPALDLVRNPILDADGYHDTYDLLTNVFASQALHDLAPIALSLGDAEAATRWAAADERIRHGVEAHLVTVVDGKQIYGEKYELDEANRFYPGYEFVNLSPIAVEWYALDREIMANTVEAYATHASRDWSGMTMLSSMQDFPSTERNDWVLAKALAWEWRFHKETGDLARLDVLDRFLRAYCPDTSQPVFEGWILDSGGTLRTTDPGNQEMASWFVVELLRAYPALREPHG